MKIQLFKKQIKFSHSKWTKIKPELHWRIAIWGFFVLLIISFSIGAYLFIRESKAINSLSFDNTKTSLNTDGLERIQKVLSMFSEREKKSAEILSSPSIFSDPSL